MFLSKRPYILYMFLQYDTVYGLAEIFIFWKKKKEKMQA